MHGRQPSDLANHLEDIFLAGFTGAGISSGVNQIHKQDQTDAESGIGLCRRLAQGLDEEIKGAGTHGFDYRLGASVPRQDHRHEQGMVLFNVREQFQAIAVGKAQVDQRARKALGLQKMAGFLERGCCPGGVARHVQKFDQQCLDLLVIVNYQNLGCLVHTCPIGQPFHPVTPGSR